MTRGERDRIGEWNGTWALAAVFGVASVPWTYGFVAWLGLPLWPSFVASAAYFAADESGVVGCARALAGAFAGIVYAALTLAAVAALSGGDVVPLAALVGVGMFLASLHAFVGPLSFTPAAFLGYASTFGVDAAGDAALGLGGAAGAAAATATAMAIGAAIGLGTDLASDELATGESVSAVAGE